MNKVLSEEIKDSTNSNNVSKSNFEKIITAWCAFSATDINHDNYLSID